MSDSQAYEELTVSADGVSVVKRFEEDEFPVPAIAFEFTSHRDEEVEVVLSDTVPDDIEVEDLGFHPEYGSEYWVIDDDNNIAFERTLGAEESYTTVYGIRATGSDNVEQFLTKPTLEEVDPPLPEDEDVPDDVIPESDDDVVKEAIAGDGEIPGLEDEDDSEDDEDVATLDLNDPNEPAQSQETGEDGSTAAESDDGGSEGTVEVEGDSVVAAMAAEIRQQNVSADDVKLLRRAFEIAGEDGGTTTAKVDQIQDDISDLRAYTNALEEFLDENGTAERIIDEFEQQVNSFEGQLSALQESLEANSEQLESVTANVDGFDEDIQSLSQEMESVSEEISSVTDRVDSLSDEVDSVTDDLESISGDVEDVSSQVDSVDEQFEDLDGAIEAIESDIDELEDMADSGKVADRIEEVEEEIDDLQTWQEQIKQTFGG